MTTADRLLARTEHTNPEHTQRPQTDRNKHTRPPVRRNPVVVSGRGDGKLDAYLDLLLGTK